MCARRLERHALISPRQEASPADVARAICGAHAQVMAAAELSIGLRMPGIQRADIRRALWEEHSLVKTYGPRGTVHLLPAQDLHLWAGALKALPNGLLSHASSALMTTAQAEEIVAAIDQVLQDAELTTDELTEALVRRLGAWAGERVMPAFQEQWPRWRAAQGAAGVWGVLCFAPSRGRSVTYTNPRRWLPGFKPAAAQTALAWLVKAYLRAYGPATPQQFARWMAAPAGWAKELFASLDSELEQVEMAGSPAWVAAGDTAVPPANPQSVHLLPYFDAYVVGSHPRERVYPGKASERALTRGQAGNYPVLLIDGMVRGVWQQRRSGRQLAIIVEPLDRLSIAQQAGLEQQVRRIGEFLESSPALSIGSVTTGGHA